MTATLTRDEIASYALHNANNVARDHYGSDEALKAAAVRFQRRACRMHRVREAVKAVKARGGIAPTEHPVYASVARAHLRDSTGRFELHCKVADGVGIYLLLPDFD